MRAWVGSFASGFLVLAVVSLLVSCHAYTPFQRGKVLEISDGGGRSATNPQDFYLLNVALSLQSPDCKRCHAGTRMAGASWDYNYSKNIITPGEPENSPLYLAVSGENGWHDPIWEEGDSELSSMREWIHLEGEQLFTPEERIENPVQPQQPVPVVGGNQPQQPVPVVGGNQPQQSVPVVGGNPPVQPVPVLGGNPPAGRTQAQLAADAELLYAQNVAPHFDPTVDTCWKCHKRRNQDRIPQNHEAAQELIDPGNPERIDLYKLVTGQVYSEKGKKHKEVWKEGDPELVALRDWIKAEGRVSLSAGIPQATLSPSLSGPTSIPNISQPLAMGGLEPLKCSEETSASNPSSDIETASGENINTSTVGTNHSVGTTELATVKKVDKTISSEGVTVTLPLVKPVVLDKDFYYAKIHPFLTRWDLEIEVEDPNPKDKFFPTVGCDDCHRGGRDYWEYETAARFVEPGNIEESRIYQRAMGINHKNRIGWTSYLPAESDEMKALKAWIMGATLEDSGVAKLDKKYFEKHVLTFLRKHFGTDEPVDPDPDDDYYPVSGCTGCHTDLRSSFKWDYGTALKYVVPENPEKSELYLRAIGERDHKQMAFLLPKSKELEYLKKWIEGASE